MDYLSISRGIKDVNGEPLIFAVGTDNVFYLTMRDAQSKEGWVQLSLSKDLGDGFKANTFAVSQNLDGKIFLAVAGARHGKHQMFITRALSQDSKKTDWKHFQKQWIPRMTGNPEVEVTQILLGTDDDSPGSAPLIVVATTETAGKTPKFYRINSDLSDDQIHWFPELQNADQILDMKVGTVPQARGVYSLYRVANEYTLEFAGVPDPQYNVSFDTTMKVPQGALTLQPKYNWEGFTDLYVNGNGKYLFESGNQTAGAVAKKIADDVDSANIKITSRASLTHDYKKSAATGKLEPYAVYRSSITFPTDVTQVDIWASEETTIEVQGKNHTIDAVKPVRLQPSVLSKLVVTIPAEALGCPTLRIHTNTMHPEQLFFICPDVEMHNKITGLDDNAIYDNRDALGVDAKYDKTDCDHVQKSLQSIAKTAQYTYNKTSHGYHHDRAVLAKNMDDTHFKLDFGSGKPRYKALDKATVKREIAGAKVLSGKAAQGFFDDVGKAFKKAGSVIVHTAEKTAEDVVDTVKHVGSDVVKTVDQVGEDLIHGDILDIPTDLMQGGENIGRDLFTGAANVVGDLVSGAGQLVVITLQLAGEAVQFVLTHTGIVGKVLGYLFEKIGVALEKALDWLLDKLGWGDVLHTHDVLKDSFNQGLEKFKGYPEKLKQTADKYFEHLESEISDDIDGALKKLGTKKLIDRPSPHSSSSGAIEKMEWLLSKFMDNAHKLSPVPALSSSTGSAAAFAGNPVLEQLIKEVEDKIGKDGNKVFDAVDGARELLVRAFSQTENTPQLLLSACLELVKAVAIAGLEAINAVVDTLLDLIVVMVETFKEAINHKIEIPFVSDLYSLITEGRDLTLLSFVSLLIALPLTILYKAIEKKPPFKNVGKAAASLTEMDDRATGWGYAYGIFHIIQAALAVADDVKNGLGARQSAGDEPVDAANTPAEFDGIGEALTYADVIVGFFAQIAANPIGYPHFSTKNPPVSDKKDPAKAPNYWAHVIWDYQWAGWTYNTYTSLVISGKTACKASQEEVNILGDFQAGFNTIWGIVHMALMSVLDVADRDKKDRLKNMRSDHWPGIDAETQAEYENYLAWTEQGGIERKGFGNIMDTFPEIGKLGAAPDLAESTEGISLIVTGAFDAVGHLGEGITYIVRTGRNGLL